MQQHLVEGLGQLSVLALDVARHSATEEDASRDAQERFVRQAHRILVQIHRCYADVSTHDVDFLRSMLERIEENPFHWLTEFLRQTFRLLAREETPREILMAMSASSGL